MALACNGDWLARCLLQAMKVEQTGSGLEARLNVCGFGRFFGAAFLAFWLAGWAIGEGVVLWILGKGAWSLLTGAPLGSDDKPIAFGVVIAIGLFLFVWLFFWTLGGVAAGRELLRLLLGRDVVLAGDNGLEIRHWYGLFRSVQRWPRDEIRRFYRISARAPLCVETRRGTTEVTRLGTVGERAELEQALNEEFGIQAQPVPARALPKAWCEVLSLEHDSVLVKDPAVRRKQARTAWIASAAASLVPLYLLSEARDRPDLLGALLFFFTLAGAVGWGAVWLSFGRGEWRLDQGRLVLQRRFGGNRTQRFEAVSLELIEDNSGEDGPNYLLTAVAAGAPAWTRSQSTSKQRRTIHSQMNDPTEPRNFGLWLSQRCELPFTDFTTAQAKAQELDALKQQLAGSGRFGRVVLRIIERLAPPPPGPKEKTGTH
jgi:hypothetical protein